MDFLQKFEKKFSEIWNFMIKYWIYKKREPQNDLSNISKKNPLNRTGGGYSPV